MKRLKKVFMVIFAITMTASVCAQADWVGKWTGKGSKNIDAELHLFSDSTFFYSFSVTLSNSVKNWDGTYSSAKYNMWAMYQGTWEGTQDNLLLFVDKSNSDGDIIQSQGLNNWDRLSLIQASASSFEDVRSFAFDVISRKGNTITVDWNDMTITKTNVSKPYYFVPPTTGKFEYFWKNASSYEMYGMYTAPNGNRTIGYWNRDAEPVSDKTATVSKTYDKEGKELTAKGDNEARLNAIDNKADMLFRTPESGSHEFAYRDGRQYNGMWSNHYPNGQGFMRYPNGDTKEGTWEKGEFIEGTVTMTGNYGKYVGEYKDGHYNGQGRYEYAENRTDQEGNHIQDGLWQNGKFIEGVVTRLIYKAGEKDTIVCEYKDGKMKGKGKYTYANGSWEEGIFDEDTELISGNVYIKNKNGGTYTGEVKNNKRDGNGTYTKGDLVVTGVWANDIIQQGKLSCPDYTYEGTFYNGMFAEGTYIQGSATLTGTWKNQIFRQGDFNITHLNGYLVKSAYGKYKRGTSGNGCIEEGTFMTDLLKISGNTNTQNTIIKLTVTYPNNDQSIGHYSSSWLEKPIEGSEFMYIWADGTTATGIIDKKLKPTKFSYTNSSGEPIKGKATKGYVMQLDSDKTACLPDGMTKSIDIMLQLFRQPIPAPKTGELYK